MAGFFIRNLKATIDIILPVYNEEEGLAIFHEALSVALSGLSQRYDFRVIYVLDRCRYNSLAVLKSIASQDRRVTVLQLTGRGGGATEGWSAMEAGGYRAGLAQCAGKRRYAFLVGPRTAD